MPTAMVSVSRARISRQICQKTTKLRIASQKLTACGNQCIDLFVM
jgi:hypothetical protein